MGVSGVWVDAQGLYYVAMFGRLGCTDHLDPDPEKPQTRYYS